MSLNLNHPILVTGAAGQIGGVGYKIVELLRAKAIPVRAMVRQIASLNPKDFQNMYQIIYTQ